MRSDVEVRPGHLPGIVEKHTTFENGSFRIDYVQDAEPLFEWNKYMRETTKSVHGQYAKRFLGSVPTTVLHQWLMESGLRYGSKEWLKFVARKLQEREYRLFQGHRL